MQKFASLFQKTVCSVSLQTKRNAVKVLNCGLSVNTKTASQSEFKKHLKKIFFKKITTRTIF